MKKKKVEEKKSYIKRNRLSFADKLALKLKHLGPVEQDACGDGSVSWVELRVGNISFNVEFDKKGEYITRIGIFKDIVEVTGQKALFVVEEPKVHP